MLPLSHEGAGVKLEVCFTLNSIALEMSLCKKKLSVRFEPATLRLMKQEYDHSAKEILIVTE
jgi:hypothetical protein